MISLQLTTVEQGVPLIYKACATPELSPCTLKPAENFICSLFPGRWTSQPEVAPVPQESGPSLRPRPRQGKELVAF